MEEYFNFGSSNYFSEELKYIQKECEGHSFLSCNCDYLGLNFSSDDFFPLIMNEHGQYFHNFFDSSINNIDDIDDNNQIINPRINDSSQNIEIIIEENEEFNGNNIIGKKRCNHPKSLRKRKYDPDNIIIKINGHFLNFIILLVNLILKKQNIKIDNFNGYFKKINIKEKKKIRKFNAEQIMSCQISDILKFANNIKGADTFHNENLYNKIKDKDNAILQKVLKMKYIDVFKNFCSSKKDKKEIIIDDGSERLEIGLPYTYDYFLNDIIAKGAEKDDKYKNKIKKVIEKYFLDKNPNKKLFKILPNL
jgi:hypothetical protein